MNFEYDKLIYGNDLDSVVYSYLTGIPLVAEKLQYPLFFECFDKKQQLEMLNCENQYEQVSTPNGIYKTNDTKANVMKKLLFVQSLLGKIKFSEGIKFVSLEGDNTLKVCTDRNRIHDVSFNKLYVINDNLLKNLDHVEFEPQKNRIIEKFRVSKNLSFRYDLFPRDTDFIKNVYMVYSSYITCVVESFIDKDKTSELEYSYIYLKQTLLRLFESHGESLFDLKTPFVSLGKEVYENNKIVYKESDSIKQIRFSTDDYLWGKQSAQSLELQDAYQHIVANKFLDMSTQTF